MNFMMRSLSMARIFRHLLILAALVEIVTAPRGMALRASSERRSNSSADSRNQRSKRTNAARASR